MAQRDRRPLIAYLRVQELWEKELLFMLARAADDAERMIRNSAGQQGIGAKIRRDQLRLVRRNIMREQSRLWEKIGSHVRAGRLDAAAAAVRTNYTYTKMLKRAGLSAADIDAMYASAEAQARRGVDHALSRMHGLSRIPLSEQVYRTEALSNGWVERKIEMALVNGKSWKELADDVKDFIRPDTPGGVAYAAKRLGRTELNNAFHATQVREAIENEFVIGMKWELSGSHPHPDECNDYAEKVHFKGGDPGVWKPEEVPSKPHPNCLCFMTHVMMDEEEFLRSFKI